jgi:hypothetical protein
MQYLPPKRNNAQFNVGDFDYQDNPLTYGEGDALYSRPILALQKSVVALFSSVNTWASSQYFTSKLYLQTGSGIHIVDSNIDISPTELGYLDNLQTNIQTQLTTNTYVSTATTGTTIRTLLGQYSDTFFTATDFNTYYKGDIMTSSYDGKYVSFCGKSTLYISSNYGVSFSAQTNATAGIIYYSIQMNSTGQYQVAVSQGVSASNIYVSNNYGITFVSIQSISTNNTGRWGMSISISQSGQFQNIGGGGGAGIQSYYSNNYGSTFVQYGNIYNRVSAVILNNSKLISLSSFNSNIITVSPLSSTTEIATEFNTFLDAIRICSNSSGNIVIIISNSATKYWISTDSGVSFTEKAGFPVSLIYAKFVDNTLYLASSTGYVYKSTDYSVSFTASNTGLTIQCFSVNSYGFMMLTTDGKIYKGYEPHVFTPP